VSFPTAVTNENLSEPQATTEPLRNLTNLNNSNSSWFCSLLFASPHHSLLENVFIYRVLIYGASESGESCHGEQKSSDVAQNPHMQAKPSPSSTITESNRDKVGCNDDVLAIICPRQILNVAVGDRLTFARSCGLRRLLLLARQPDPFVPMSSNGKQ
jgi:hypothetical protein